MKFLNGDTIQLDKVINDLDQLIIDIISILKKFTDYVVVGGYVSILFGRSRMSEDIDVLIPKVSLETFTELYYELRDNHFWCLNSESIKDNYELLIDAHAIRITRENWVIPNVEIRFITDDLDKLTFETRLTVKLPGAELEVSRPEIQIPYKRFVLRSDKDIEDAIYLEEIFKKEIDLNLLKKSTELITHGYTKE